MPGVAVGQSTRNFYIHRRERLIQLAKPKASKAIWITSVGPRVQWGTQEVLWPVSLASLNATTTSRLQDLAVPKKNFQSGDKINRPEFVFSCGRSSVLWEVSPTAREAKATKRIEELAKAKQPPKEFQDDRPLFVFSCGRSSPIWEVERGAKTAPERPRTEQLSRAKSVHQEFLANRTVQTSITPAALRARSSSRLESLSIPKSRPDGPFREPIWPVTDLAKKASPSGRCMELSKPKSIVDGYIPAREVVWQVTKAAKRASANTRLDEISRPIIRASMDHVQFDPDAFLVKETALKGRASKRIEELAVPLNR